MNLKNILETNSDERAVSPVIGVILMVAITVILAAVIGAFVIGIGEDQEVQPTASFDFDFDTDDDLVTVSHSQGDSISEPDTVEVLVDGEGDDDPWVPEEETEIGAGSQVVVNSNGEITDTAADEWSGETVSVVWESETGDSSATLSSTTAPDN